jgi:hypothetical protein
VIWLLSACHPDPARPKVEDPDRPLLVCPGDPECPDAKGPLLAGAAVRSILPTCWETYDDLDGDVAWDPIAEPFRDCGCDRLCPGDPGWVAADDGEGDGVFEASWLAGFQNGRAATGTRDASLGLRGEGDGLWASALVLDQGSTRIAVVALDAFGVMIDDTHAIRDAADAAGLDIDYLVVHSSHTHAAPDTLGIYGQDLTHSGYDPRYLALVRDQVVDALAEAVAELEPATMEVGEVDADDYHEKGVGNVISDQRDPVIVDSRVSVARFVGLDGGTVATVVHFSNHPEETADVWSLFTSNFAHALRRTVAEGVDWGDGLRPGVGGVPIFWNGSVGGMMSSLHASVQAPDGTIWGDRTFEKSDALGQLIGDMALDAVAEASPVDVHLGARRSEVFLPVRNNGYQAMFLVGALDSRQVYHYDPSLPLGEDTNFPDIQTEVGELELGPLKVLCVPGEWFPELFIGGYDGSHTPPGEPIVDPTNPNPPDLSLAPPGPYLEDVLDGSPGWLLGLANDQIGYVVPEPFFELGPVPYLMEAEGDHYEETNSLGAETAPMLVETATKLVTWEP